MVEVLSARACLVCVFVCVCACVCLRVDFFLHSFWSCEWANIADAPFVRRRREWANPITTTAPPPRRATSTCTSWRSPGRLTFAASVLTGATRRRGPSRRPISRCMDCGQALQLHAAEAPSLQTARPPSVSSQTSCRGSTLTLRRHSPCGMPRTGRPQWAISPSTSTRSTAHARAWPPTFTSMRCLKRARVELP